MNTVLVTGGGGFLGSALVKALLKGGHQVRGLSRGGYPELEALGVTWFRGDIADAAVVNRAVEGCDLVFHVAAKAGIWGSYDSYYQANVVGTSNVIAACRAHGVGKLVHTSSPSVVYAGQDQEGVDESTPIPSRFIAHYPATKALAEELVNQANGPTLATVALRPHLIWGPGDNHLLPRLVERHRVGKLQLISKTNVVDAVYVDNAVYAHLLAAEKLVPGSSICGKNYFITNGQPMKLTEIINNMMKAAGLGPVTKFVPAPLAFMAGMVLEGVFGLFGIKDEPRITRFMAQQMSTSHWFNDSAARWDLGYEPQVSMAEGFRRLESHLKASTKQATDPVGPQAKNGKGF